MVLGAVLVSTLAPAPGSAAAAAGTPLSCILCGSSGLRDFLLNILLFVPLGCLLYRVGLPALRVLLFGFGLSLLIETIQFILPIGRDASLSDVLSNSLGAGLGAALALHLRNLTSPSAVLARRLAAGIFLAWAAFGILGAWADQALPAGEGILAGSWARTYPGTGTFGGTIESATVAGVEVHNWDVARPGPIRRALEGDSIGTQVRVTSLPRADRWSQVFAVGDWGAEPVLELSLEGCQLRYEMRTRALSLRLGLLTMVLPVTCSHEPAGLHAMKNARVLQLSAAYGSATRASTIVLTAAHAWALFMPIARLMPLHRLWHALWILSFALPLGFWATLGWPGRLSLALISGAAMMLGSEAIVAQMFGCAWPTVAETALVAAGLLLGRATARLARVGQVA